MGLSRLSEKCKDCPFIEKCKNKRMEAFAFLPEPILAEARQPIASELAAPLLRETMEIHVDGKTLTVYKDEIEKQLYGHLYSHLGLQFGG